MAASAPSGTTLLYRRLNDIMAKPSGVILFLGLTPTFLMRTSRKKECLQQGYISIELRGERINEILCFLTHISGNWDQSLIPTSCLPRG